MMSAQPTYSYPTLEEHFLFRGTMERSPRTVLPFHKRVFGAVTAWALGTLPDGKRHLAVCIPPRHGKTIIAHDAVAWLTGLFPDSQWIYASYSTQMAVTQTQKIRTAMSSEWYRQVYPWVGLKPGQGTQKYFETACGGHVYGAGMDGTITGFGAGVKREGFGGGLIIDDPLKPLEARSETMRGNTNLWFTETLLSRRNSTDTPILIIMQRLHPSDLVGHVMATMPGEWEVLTIPALDEAADPGPAAMLWPETFSHKDAAILREVDPGTFHAQYQQSPILPGGNIIKRDWWKYYDPADTPSGGYCFITADTAYKAKSTADASVLRAWLGTPDALHCLDAVYGRWEFPRLLEEARAFYLRWRELRCQAFYVEDKASGTPLEQTLRSQGIPAHGWRPGDYNFPDDKVGRVHEAAWAVHGGHVLLPEGAAHSDALVEEAAAFNPDMSHDHDDHVDTMTMAVSIWKYAGGGRRQSGEKA